MSESTEKGVAVKPDAAVRKNIIANMIGSGWSALLSFAFVPLYIHFMGIESYGIVGFYVTLQVLFSVLDMGLTATLSRELARLSIGGEDNAGEMRNVVRTLEIIYWVLAAAVILFVMLGSDWISTFWLNSSQLSTEVISLSVMLMGVVIAFRMPYGFYSGGLIGLQKQVQLNRIKIVVETVRNGGGVIVLWLVSPSVIAFFAWHALAALAAVFLLAVVLWKNLPPSKERATFTAPLFRRLWRFGAEMSVITVLGLLVAELDKVVLSKMLPLDQFGYYMLAATLAMGINLIIVPIFTAIHPRLTQLVADEDDAGVRRLYHKGSQLMAAIVMPVAITLSIFAEPLLTIWTQSESTAHFSAPFLSILVIGTALNAMMNIPYAMQIAHGWVKLSIISNAVAAVFLVPSLIWAISEYGAIGAAFIWLSLNTGYVLINSPLIHRRLLPGEFWRWLFVDNSLAVIASLLVVSLSWLALPEGLPMSGEAIWIAVTLLLSLMLVAVLLPATRSTLMNFRTIRSRRSHI
ncbi:lipopolysaccharide biosynthesis protein [Pseudomonadota bacterium]